MTEFEKLLKTALEGWKAMPAPSAATNSSSNPFVSNSLSVGTELPRVAKELLSAALPAYISDNDGGSRASVSDDSSRASVSDYSSSGRALAGIERIVANQVAARPVVSTDEQVVAASTKKSAAPTSSDSGLGQTVLKTAGMITGLGPLIAGIAGLFGSGGNTEPALQPSPYALPDRLRVEAGLDKNRQITNVGSKQDGSLYSQVSQSPAPSSQAQQPKIEITVQAMDSRSFMDHSDDIARAVQQAMLRSHPLNDVVSEL